MSEAAEQSKHMSSVLSVTNIACMATCRCSPDSSCAGAKAFLPTLHHVVFKSLSWITYKWRVYWQFPAGHAAVVLVKRQGTFQA